MTALVAVENVMRRSLRVVGFVAIGLIVLGVVAVPVAIACSTGTAERDMARCKSFQRR
jgi:hypothetical protein